MRRSIIGVACGLLLVLAPAGQAHKSYCGHTVKVWQVWSYGTPIDYKEDYNFNYSYWSGGRHWHARDTYWREVTTDFDPWHYIHRHYEACESTPS